MEEWKREPLPKLMTGHDLLALGMEQGPLIGKILEEILEKQIAGEIGTREQALDYARQVLEEGEKKE